MPKHTSNLRDLAANLRHIANLLETADLGELAAPVNVSVYLHPVHGGDPTALVDQIATITGKPAAFPTNPSTTYEPYSTELTGDDQPWTLRCSVYMRMPDPKAAMQAELDQLRAQLAELQQPKTTVPTGV